MVFDTDGFKWTTSCWKYKYWAASGGPDIGLTLSKFDSIMEEQLPI